MAVINWRKINMHRDHRWAGAHMSEYVDGELGDRQQRRLAAHERLCPECGRVIRTLRGMLGSIGGKASRTDPAEAAAAVDRALDSAAARGDD